jgi:hypothetical protein
MNSWLESLEDIVDAKILNQFEGIYYLNSKMVLKVEDLDKIVSEQKLGSYLSKEDPETEKDVLDFFLLANDETQSVLVLLSPFDFFTDESIFKIYENVEEDLSSVPTIEVVK